MKRVRLQIQVLPWEESISRQSRGAREHDNDIRPWLQPEDADNTLQQLVDNINQRYARIYIGRGALRIKELQDSWGSTLDLFDKVGDVFDDRSPSGENLTSICKVVRYPPQETELHDSQRFASLLPESAARPQKRPLPPSSLDFRRPLPSVEETTLNSRGSAFKRRKTDCNATSGSRGRSQVSEPRPRKTPVSAQQSRDQEPILQVLDSQATQRKEIGGLVSPSSEQAPSPNRPHNIASPDSSAQDQTSVVASSQEGTRSESPELTLSLAEASQRPQPHILSSDHSDASDQHRAESGSDDLPNVPHAEPELRSTPDRDEIVDSTSNTQDVFKKPDLPRRVLRPLSTARLKMSNRASSTNTTDPIESDSESLKGRLMKQRLRRRKPKDKPSARQLDSLQGVVPSPEHGDGVETGDQAQNQIDEGHATAARLSHQEPALTGSAEPSGPSQPQRPAETMPQAPASSDIIRESSLKGDASTNSQSIHPSTTNEKLPKDAKRRRNPSKVKGLEKDATSNLRSQQESRVDSAPTKKIEHHKNNAKGLQQTNDESVPHAESDTSRQRIPIETETLNHSRHQDKSPIEPDELNDIDASDVSRDSGPAPSVGSKPSKPSSGTGSVDSVLEDLNEASLHGDTEKQNGEHDEKQMPKSMSSHSDDYLLLQQKANPIEEEKEVERSSGENGSFNGQQLLRSARGRRNLKQGTKPLPNGTSMKQESRKIERSLKSERRSPQETINPNHMNPAMSLEEKIKLHREQMLAEQAKIEMLARDGAKELAAEQARLKMKPMSAKTNGWTSGQDRSMESAVTASQVKSRRSSRKIKDTNAEPSDHHQVGEESVRRDSPSVESINGYFSKDLNKEAMVHTASDQKQTSKSLRPRRSTGRKRSLTPPIPDTASPFMMGNPDESASPLQAKTARADRALQRNASQTNASALRRSVSFAPAGSPQPTGRMENGSNAMTERADSNVEPQPKDVVTSSRTDSAEVNEDDDDEQAARRSSFEAINEIQPEEQQPSSLDENEDDGASSFVEDEDVGWGAPVSASQSYKQTIGRTDVDPKDVTSIRNSVGEIQGVRGSKRLSRASKLTPAATISRKKGKEVVREMPQLDAASSVTSSGSSSESETDSQSTYILSDDDVPEDQSEDKVVRRSSKRAQSTKVPKSKKSSSKATPAQGSVSRASKATAASSKKASAPSQDANKAPSPPPASQAKPTDDQPATKPAPSRSTSKSSYKYPTLSKLHRAAEGRMPTPPSSSAPALASRSFSSQPSLRASSQQQQQQQRQQQRQQQQQQQQQQALHLGKQGPDSGSEDDDSSSSSSSDDSVEGGAPVPAMPAAKGASILPGMKGLWNLMSAGGSAR